MTTNDITKGIPLDRLAEICEAERDGRCVVMPDMPQNMNDILEPLKLQSALQSELMKLDFRKANHPKDVSILDYTVIAALQKCLEAAEAALKEGAK